MSERKSFIVHKDSLAILDELTDSQAGQLFKAIRSYQAGEDPELDPLIRIAFSSFKNQFKRDDAKYQEIVKVRKTSGGKGGHAKQLNLANATKSYQHLATVADSVSVSVSKSDSDSKRLFKQPTKEEIEAYLIHLAYEGNLSKKEAEKFFNFYQSKGWKIGKSSMVSWKHSIVNWMKRKDENETNKRNESELDFNSTGWSKDIKPVG